MTASGQDFIPNPKRAIRVRGLINQRLADRLVPRIQTLQARSREPITVYINSEGGNTNCADQIRCQLFARYPDGMRCRILTVAEAKAFSSAADLLASASLAHQDSVVLFHGTRLPFIEDLTSSTAAQLNHELVERDSFYANELIEATEGRFCFRCLLIQPDMDVGAYLDTVGKTLSPNALEVAGAAWTTMNEYLQIISGLGTPPSRDVRLLKMMIAKQFKNSVPRQQLAELVQDFFTLQFYLQMTATLPARRAYQYWLASFITRRDVAEMTDQELLGIRNERERSASGKNLEKVRNLWLFFIALCRCLQQGQTYLTATDSLALGLIDEVIGLKGVPTLRLLASFSEAAQ